MRLMVVLWLLKEQLLMTTSSTAYVVELVKQALTHVI